MVLVHCVSPLLPSHPQPTFCPLSLRLRSQDPHPFFLLQWQDKTLSASLQFEIPPAAQVTAGTHQHCWASSWCYWARCTGQLHPWAVMRSKYLVRTDFWENFSCWNQNLYSVHLVWFFKAIESGYIWIKAENTCY